MSNASFKDDAHRLIDRLPVDATWEDLQHAICVRQAIESGVRDSDACKTLSSAEARARLGLVQP